MKFPNRTTIAVILAIGAFRCLASDPPAASDTPAPDMALSEFMRQLTTAMTGRPVMAVRSPMEGGWTEAAQAALDHASSDIAKLQAISAAYSDKDHALIPFQVGSLYALAPETREALNPGLASLSMQDIAGPGALLSDVLGRLTPEQAKALGSAQGIAITDLSPDLQREVALAFKSPLEIATYKRGVRNDNGLPQIYFGSEPGTTFELPVDWTRTRIRARLRMSGARVQGAGASGFIPPSSLEGPVITTNPDLPDPEENFAAFTTIPNTFKPSDLVGKPYEQPIGISGVTTVQKVVDRLAKVTGLTLSVWKPYREEPVFLGNASLRAGDVLDGLRLGLTASWRKMGSAYYLVWDRIPIGAIEQTVVEATAGAADALRKFNAADNMAPGYARLVDTLPFADDDPLSPTDAQRRLLFGPTSPDEKLVSPDDAVPFDSMTPAQKDFLRTQAPDSVMNSHTPGQDGQSGRAMTAEDLGGATLMASGTVEVSLLTPGHGWLPLQMFGMGLHFSRWELDNARRKADPAYKPAPGMDEIPGDMGAIMKHPKPVTLPSAVRGLVVPALSPEPLNALADEMKRHGLNVLFYPVLFGGYSTLPNSGFPLDPALRGSDGLAAAISAMKSKDIRVVAYLNTLAWQNQGDSVHWLNKRPDLLDVDVLGRGRLAWLKLHPDTPRGQMMDMAPDAYNYVRATAPEVETRLKTLIHSVAAREGVSAVAFAAWEPREAPRYANAILLPPNLGFAWADRLAAFQKIGADPADSVTRIQYIPDSLRALVNDGSPEDAGMDDAHVALVGRLTQAAHAARKDWRVYLVNDNTTSGAADTAQKAPSARPDLTIVSAFAGDPTSVMGQGMMFPVTGRTIAEVMPDDGSSSDADMMRSWGHLSPVVMFAMVFSRGAPLQGRTLPMALYDLRGHPEIITDTLKWVARPGGAGGRDKSVK